MVGDDGSPTVLCVMLHSVEAGIARATQSARPIGSSSTIYGRHIRLAAASTARSAIAWSADLKSQRYASVEVDTSIAHGTWAYTNTVHIQGPPFGHQLSLMPTIGSPFPRAKRYAVGRTRQLMGA